MSKPRKKYDKEFKLMAVELGNTRSDLVDLAQELGIRVSLLYRWRKEHLEIKSGSFPGHGKPKLTEEQAEINRLKKEVMDRQLERDILKKVVGIFSRKDGKNSNL